MFKRLAIVLVLAATTGLAACTSDDVGLELSTALSSLKARTEVYLAAAINNPQIIPCVAAVAAGAVGLAVDMAGLGGVSFDGTNGKTIASATSLCHFNGSGSLTAITQ